MAFSLRGKGTGRDEVYFSFKKVYSLELEEAVLGALMIEKDAYSLVSEILRPESFYEHRHQLIYSAISDRE